MRLVPPQDPEECLRLLAAHVKKLNPDVEVTFEKGLRPYSGQRTGPHAEAAAEALDFGFGARPAYVREGGSIGAVLSMAEAWRAPITPVAYDMTKSSGFYEKNPGTDVSVRQMMNKPATPNSKGLRFGSFVQIRDMFQEEFENMLAGKQDAKTALDNAVKRGNEMLRRFEKTAKDAG
jgi:ABC-type glycerol-3-phosphate transport system substrate-binding protein